MDHRFDRLVIDARPQGPAGPLAAERIRGRSVLERALEQAEALGAARCAIVAQPEDHSLLCSLATESSSDRFGFTQEPPSVDAFVLRTDRLYDRARLRRALRRGGDPESAVLWRLDGPHGLAGAEQELERRQTYQPLGRYWALAPARALARALRPTRVRPNGLTLASGVLMLGGASVVAFGPVGFAANAGVGLALALALVLDTADGHLARLQGTASSFGRWLDAFLDELADMALHAAIAWGAFARDGHPGWLVLGMLYGMGKYQFTIATIESRTDAVDSPIPHLSGRPLSRGLRRLAGWVRLAGHADLRWHLWIVLAALGRLDAALAAYAFYFPLRAVAVAVRKGVRRG